MQLAIGNRVLFLYSVIFTTFALAFPLFLLALGSSFLEGGGGNVTAGVTWLIQTWFQPKGLVLAKVPSYSSNQARFQSSAF